MKLCAICLRTIINRGGAAKTCGEACAYERKKEKDRDNRRPASEIQKRKALERWHSLSKAEKSARIRRASELRRHRKATPEGREADRLRRKNHRKRTRRTKNEENKRHHRRNAVAYQVLKQLGIFINSRTLEVTYANPEFEARFSGSAQSRSEKPNGVIGISD